jgi:O-antigen ligase
MVHKMKKLIKPAFLLAITGLCLLRYNLNRQAGIFRTFEATVFSFQWIFLVCLVVWCCTFLLLTCILNDLPLIGLLLIAIASYFIGYIASQSATDTIILLAGVTLGKSAFVLLRRDEGGNSSVIRSSEFGVRSFLTGLVLLLAFSSWWHLDVAHNYYPGTRWTGLWDNPNIYGMLMGAGLTLAIGLRAGVRSSEFGVRNKSKDSVLSQPARSFAAVKSAIRNPQSAILLVAAGMMGVGLIFSYSRGAWVGTAVGLLYLAKVHGRFKWRWVLPPVLVALVVICFFWNNTSDTAPWFVKRLDLGRASAQHRVSAWRGAVQMMRDHPFGVGWNKTVDVYEKKYSPPENGAPAIATNDYLMLGTQLGFPGLLCFVAYVGLCFRKCGARSAECGIKELRTPNSEFRIKTACRAGALALLVAFWFDGGLFKLATASVFWILLELGSERQKLKTEMLKAETDQKAEGGGEGGVRNQTDLSLVTLAATK